MTTDNATNATPPREAQAEHHTLTQELVAALEKARPQVEALWTVFYGKPSMYPVGAPTPKSTPEPGEEVERVDDRGSALLGAP